jgi:enoyl-CoA hydratase
VARAKELAYTGGMVTAEEGREIGLVNKVFPPDALWDETMKTAQVMASKGRVSLKGIKDCMNRGNDIDLRDGCFMELDAFALCYVSSDSKEGLNAFLEKRTPEFKEKLC